MQELLNSVETIAAPMCMKNNTLVEIDCSDCSDIHGNFEMLLQIFINLVVNANKHTKDGTITVSASDAESPQYVVFRVSDTGSGIADEHLPHIFEEGYSASGSSGLGLVICKEAVEAHNGRIWVEKTDEKGTVFSFTIPKEGEEG